MTKPSAFEDGWVASNFINLAKTNRYVCPCFFVRGNFWPIPASLVSIPPEADGHATSEGLEVRSASQNNAILRDAWRYAGGLQLRFPDWDRR